MNLQKYLNQTAVYWANPVSDGLGGYTYDDPVEVKVRWSDKQEKFLSSESTTQEGVEELLSKSFILAESDFDVNGRMFLGYLIDLESDNLPGSVNALTIKLFEKIPNIGATQFLRKVYLI